MVKRLFLFYIIIGVGLLLSCSDKDSFSASSSNVLTLSTDTVKIDTLFSQIPSSTKSFWVYNNSSDGIRISTVRLERGNQSGFRVNVDGTFVNPVATDFEVREGDSIRVFVEVTTRDNYAEEPQLIEDNLLFTLESGVVQRVNLRTYSWDALKLSGLVVRHDTLIESSVPVVIYDSLRVDSGCTLTIRNTTLYFHDNVGIVAYGKIKAENSVFRGDRLDHMFDYLPYDRVSGQWRGITIKPSSKDNQFTDCEIRNAMDGIVCDSTSLTLIRCKVHNSRGHGVIGHNATLTISYCQLTNTLGDCLAVYGGTAEIDHCTLAQFYPFSANRKAALRFTNSDADLLISCMNTLVTGYEADVVMGLQEDSVKIFDYYFADCILRTDSVADSLRFERVMWETPADSVEGKKHFRIIDETNLYYDFTIDSISPAFSRGIGCQ